MIDREHTLPISKQTDVLRISRGSAYYLPPAAGSGVRTPTSRSCGGSAGCTWSSSAGSRKLQGLLMAEGSKIGRRHRHSIWERSEFLRIYN